MELPPNTIDMLLASLEQIRKNIGTYPQRSVECYDESDQFIVSTCRVFDGELPFETAVSHKRYNNGKWMIVEAYSTRDQSRIGHRKWIETMKGDLPEKFTDCANAPIAKLLVQITGHPLEYHLDGKGDEE